MHFIFIFQAVSPLLANMNGPSNLNYSTEDFLNSGCIYVSTFLFTHINC